MLSHWKRQQEEDSRATRGRRGTLSALSLLLISPRLSSFTPECFLMVWPSVKWCIVHRSMSPRARLPLAQSITVCSLGNFQTLNNPAWAPFISNRLKNDSKSFLKATLALKPLCPRGKTPCSPPFVSVRLITSKYNAFSKFHRVTVTIVNLEANH